MKKFLLSLLIAATAASGAFAANEKRDSLGFVFTDVKVVKSTPVKNQAKS